jgi:membrane protease subunit HflC
MSRSVMVLIGLGLALVIASTDALFIVNQYEQAIIRQFGAPQPAISEPGLKIKIPFIQDVVILDKRLLEMDPPAEEVILADQKRIVIDSYMRYRISNPLVFYQAVGTEAGAQSRLREVVTSALRRVLGNATMASLLSEERATIMADILTQLNNETERFGIAVADVRIRRADLPTETSQSIYDRMKSEREREAREARAQGQERAQQIRSRADRERTVILAEAQRQAQINRGEGDGEANRTFAEAYSKDPAFFDFYRSLQAYRQSFGDHNTTLLLSPDSEFFRHFAKPAPR